MIRHDERARNRFRLLAAVRPVVLKDHININELRFQFFTSYEVITRISIQVASSYSSNHTSFFIFVLKTGRGSSPVFGDGEVIWKNGRPTYSPKKKDKEDKNLMRRRSSAEIVMDEEQRRLLAVTASLNQADAQRTNNSTSIFRFQSLKNIAILNLKLSQVCFLQSCCVS